jgi:hypothetical protein
MLSVVKRGSPKPVLENRDINRMWMNLGGGLAFNSV